MKRYKIFKLKWEIIPIIIFLGIWEIIARLNLIPGHFFFPPFSAVVTEFWYLTTSGVLGRNFLSSLIQVLIGFSAGSIAGLFIGIIMGWNNIANKALNPIISLIYPIPALGWLPLLMLWFGIGEILPIAIIFICSFFPILYNTVTGIKNVDKNYIFVARILGASDLKILSTVVVPPCFAQYFYWTKIGIRDGLASDNSGRNGSYSYRDWGTDDESRKSYSYRYYYSLSNSFGSNVSFF